MKNILLLIFCSIIFLNSAFSQGAKVRLTPEEKKAKQLIESDYTAFTLTDDQKAQLTPILIAQIKSLDSLEAAPLPRGVSEQMGLSSVKFKRVDIYKMNDVKIIALLTDVQKKMYPRYADRRDAAVFNPPTERPVINTVRGRQ